MKRILKNLPYLILVCFIFFTFSARAEAASSASEVLTLKVKNTVSGVALSWNGSEKDVCSVYKKTGDGKYVKITEAKGKSYTDKEVKSGEKYGYYIKKSKKIKSEKISAVYLSAPKIRKATADENGITLRWKAVGGAEKYTVYRRTESGKFKKLSSTELLTFTDRSAEPNVKYYYAIKASGKGAAGAKGKETAAVKLRSPDISEASVTDKGISVSWKKVSCAEKYILYRRQSKKEDWKEIAKLSSKSLSYTDTSVRTGKKYTYAVNILTDKTESGFDGRTLSCTYIAAPKSFSLNQQSKKITLTWKKVSGATGYEIYKKVSTGKWKKLTLTEKDELKFTETLSSINNKVSYKIRTVTSKGKSAFAKSLVIRYINPNKPMVALTYDDGPHPVNTHAILDVLEKYNATATFFVVGNRIEAYHDCLERQSALSCETGNHSYSHASLSSSSDKIVKEQISKTDKLIKKYTGQPCTVARAPGGSEGKALRLTDKPFIRWSVDTRDWESRSSKKIISHIKSTARDGSIILMHDLYDATAKATEEIVPWLIKEGYQLVTVSELMEARGTKLKKGTVYFNGYPQ